MPITIRNAVISDYAAIAELARTSLGYDCNDELVKDRLAHTDSDREAVFVAEKDGTVTGFVHAHIYEVLYYQPMINILGLAVSENQRRQGIGRLLMQRAEQWAGDNGIELVRLNSGGKRTGAHEFYRSIGFDNEKVQLRFLKKI